MRHASLESGTSRDTRCLRGVLKLSDVGNASSTVLAWSTILACRFLSFSTVTSISNVESSLLIKSVGGASKSVRWSPRSGSDSEPYSDPDSNKSPMSGSDSYSNKILLSNDSKLSFSDSESSDSTLSGSDPDLNSVVRPFCFRLSLGSKSPSYVYNSLIPLPSSLKQ